MSNRLFRSVWLPACLLLVAGSFTFFYRLGTSPMHLWDESSYAINAQEMLETGNPIEVQLLGRPDIYNSKPPFAIWCMSAGIYLFGFNEFGVRFASALFGLLSCLVLYGVGLRVLKNKWEALMPPLVLMSSMGFVGEHIARTGDTDSILAFWILLQSVFIWMYTESNANENQTNRYLFLAGIAFTLGCLTKGIAGLTALPGLLVWIGYRKKLKAVLTTSAFYRALLFFTLIVPGYYVLRSYLTPGYWHAVVNFEIGGRLWQQEYLNPDQLPVYFYFQQMFEKGRFFGWIVMLPMAIVAILWRFKEEIGRAGLAFICMLLSVSVMLGVSQTKLFWYDAPLYPLMAAVIGIGFGVLLKYNRRMGVLLFALSFISPWVKVIDNNQRKDGTHLGECLAYLRYEDYRNDSIFIINADPNFVVHFYAMKDSLNGYFCRVVTPQDSQLGPGKFILTEKYAREVDMNQQYLLDTIYRYQECSYYRIIDKK